MNRKDAYADMLHQLETLQEEMTGVWLGDSLPDDWQGMDHHFPVPRKKTRVTIRLDADMVAWFRKMGPGYSRRMNLVLRIYYTSLMSGHIKAHPYDRTIGRFATEAYRLINKD